MLKQVLTAVAALATMTIATTASANVSKVDLFVARLGTPASCFVQVDLKTVEQNMFNGQEKLRVGADELATFAPLQSAGKSIAVGKSVLFGSPAFATETGITPDISITDENCAKVAPKAAVELQGSFGPVAGSLTLPDDFSALDVVGLALLVHLEDESYKVKWLDGEKEIGKAGGSSTSSGATGSSSSGATSSGATASSTGGPSSAGSTANGPSGSDDGSCTIARRAPGSPGSVAFVGGLALGAGALVRRRSRARA
jgi:hypothetical protein